MSGSPDGIYEPGLVDPGIPVSNSTKSFWLSQSAPIARTQSPWINTADVVIIGSGMSGMNLARTLYQKSAKLKIVLLDARDLCSGATGRNGGHIKTMSYNYWLDRKAKYGVKEAICLTNFEHSHLEHMTATIRESELNCELNLIEGIDVYYDKSNFADAIAAISDMERYAPELASQYTVYTDKAKLGQLNCSDRSIGAIGTPAASMWPYKMVTGLLSRLITENGLCVQSNTKVVSITDRKDDKFAVVHTDRGNVRARHVVHATNAWLGHLLPELRPYISPVRGNVIHQTVHSPHRNLENSFWHRYSSKDWDYLIQRPSGGIVVGRASTGRRATGDDSETDVCPQIHLRGVMAEMYSHGHSASEVSHAWSGILGYTQDGSAFAGRLPFSNRGHQWVCGGYQGIGMIKAFRMAEMVARMIVGEDVSQECPTSFLVTEERMKKLKQSLSAKPSL